jgi:phosphoglycolate phosphatase
VLQASIPFGAAPLKTSAVFFDLDGTLTDSKAGITRSIQHAMSELGYMAPAESELFWCIGPPLRNSFARLFETTDDQLIDEALRLYRERFSTVGLFENRLYEDVPEMLHAVRELGHPLYVVTAKPHVFATRIIDHFGLTRIFEKVYGSELDGIRSDKGDLIAHVLAEESLGPSRAVMIGDREHDVIGSRRSDVQCIGVTYGYGTHTELSSCGATCIAATPQAISPLVRSLLGVRV